MPLDCVRKTYFVLCMFMLDALPFLQRLDKQPTIWRNHPSADAVWWSVFHLRQVSEMKLQDIDKFLLIPFPEESVGIYFETDEKLATLSFRGSKEDEVCAATAGKIRPEFVC